METLRQLLVLLIFPSGLFILLCGLAYEWVYRKLVARMQNRIGPRWFQPVADVLKLMSKEEIVPEEVNRFLFTLLPIGALAGALTASLYLPIIGLPASASLPGDLIITFYLLSLVSICVGLAGANSRGRFSVIGATRTLTQVFSYEAPFLLALLGPALLAETWQISRIAGYAQNSTWMILTQPVGFLVALIGLMGKLELPPFDAPEAETEIVAGALTEYSGRGLALFRLSKAVEMVAGLTLIATLFMGGISNPLDFLLKTIVLLFTLALLQVLLTRFRIDQVVRWWRYGALLALGQMLATIILIIAM